MLFRPLVLATLLLCGPAAAQPPAPAIDHVDLDSAVLQIVPHARLVTSRTTFAPRAVTGWHFHPGQDFIYVVEGSLVLEARGVAPIALAAGQTHMTPTGQVHRASNPSVSAPAVVLAFSVVPEGQEASTPAR